MDSLTLNFDRDALQRLYEALSKTGSSPRLSEKQSWFEIAKTFADAAEETAPHIDPVIAYLSTKWQSFSDEDIEFFKSLAQYAEATLKMIEEDSLLIRLLLFIPSIRRRKNLYELLQQSDERLVSAISAAIFAWEEQRKREFNEAASYVLKKNAELHRRLA